MAQQAPPVSLEQSMPPLEAPDDDLRHCLGILGPILQMTISELDQRGKPGWAGFLDTIFATINDVLVPDENAV